MPVRTRSGDYSKFGSIRILRDGRVRLSARAYPGLPELDFLVIHDDDPGRDGISARWRGQTVFLLFLARHRVESTCFGYGLSPDSLREAVTVLREAGNGLERWLIPGLESTQRALSGKQRNPEMLAIIPELLKSMRDLPVAPQWRKRLRFLDRWERENAGAPDEGDRPRRGSGTKRRS